jgi:hypothetical protein
LNRGTSNRRRKESKIEIQETKNKKHHAEGLGQKAKGFKLK